MFKDTMEKIGEPCIASKVVQYGGGRGGIRPRDRPVRSSSVRPIPSAAPAAASPTPGDELRGDRRERPACTPACTRSWSRSASPAGKRSNLRSCAMRKGNAITVCNMENVDPVGVHTGDSHRRRAQSDPVRTRNIRCSAPLRLTSSPSLGIEGGCNVPVRPASDLVRVRGHRGQPPRIALVRAGLQGHRLPDRQGGGQDCHRLRPGRDRQRRDRQDLRLLRADHRLLRGQVPAAGPLTSSCTPDSTLGTQMKATGEVMAIGNSFEGALMKAVRGMRDQAGQHDRPAHPATDRRGGQKGRGPHATTSACFAVYEALQAAAS